MHPLSPIAEDILPLLVADPTTRRLVNRGAERLAAEEFAAHIQHLHATLYQECKRQVTQAEVAKHYTPDSLALIKEWWHDVSKYTFLRGGFNLADGDDGYGVVSSRESPLPSNRTVDFGDYSGEAYLAVRDSRLVIDLYTYYKILRDRKCTVGMKKLLLLKKLKWDMRRVGIPVKYFYLKYNRQVLSDALGYDLPDAPWPKLNAYAHMKHFEGHPTGMVSYGGAEKEHNLSPDEALEIEIPWLPVAIASLKGDIIKMIEDM